MIKLSSGSKRDLREGFSQVKSCVCFGVYALHSLLPTPIEVVLGVHEQVLGPKVQNPAGRRASVEEKEESSGAESPISLPGVAELCPKHLPKERTT